MRPSFCLGRPPLDVEITRVSPFIRRYSVLFVSLGMALLLASCTEKTTVSRVVAPQQGPSLGYAPRYGCDNLTPATTCLGTVTTNDVRFEEFRVCKVYPGGTGPDVEIKLHADYVLFQDSPVSAQTGSYTLHAGECLILWRNGEHPGVADAADTVTISETPVPGYTTTSQVTTIIRDQPDPTSGATFTTTVGPVTSATSVTGVIGGKRIPGVLVVFTNTPIPTNQQPTPIANGPYVNVEGSTVTFSSAGTADPEGDPLTYLWTFGDGGTSTAQNPTHTYADNGVYPVTVTVDDGHGHPATANTTATISNLPPVPTLTTSTATVYCNQLGAVVGTFTDAGVIDQLWSYDINWGDGSAHTVGTTLTQSGTIPATHAYAANGTYTVTLTVTDKDGGVGSATTHITMSCAFASCGFTQGYWKNHEQNWPAPYSPTATWLNATHVTPTTWDGLMGMNVSGGNSYMQLAHQWIAATLNRGTGAPMNASVLSVLNQAGAWLLLKTPANGSVPTFKDAQATAWASVLDDYNNGKLGTPHCN